MSSIKKASELRVSQWIDGEGREMAALTLDQLGNGLKIIFCFQDWCPGCHSNGFPSLKYLVDKLEPYGVGFAAIQTVFEGFDQNKFEHLITNQNKYDLKIPFGHDSIDGKRPTIMEDYGTGGTPWFIIINENDEIVFSDFHIDHKQLVESYLQGLDSQSE